MEEVGGREITETEVDGRPRRKEGSWETGLEATIIPGPTHVDVKRKNENKKDYERRDIWKRNKMKSNAS